MIKGISSSGKYIAVSGGYSSPSYIAPGTPGAGQVWYDSNTGGLKVFDGSNWVTLSSSYSTIEMTPEAESLLDWARSKRAEEERLEAMMERYPALRKAKENFDILLNLTKDDYEASK